MPEGAEPPGVREPAWHRANPCGAGACHHPVMRPDDASTVRTRTGTNEARPTAARPGPLLAAFAALLDRSLAQLAEASADGRRFDRETLAAVSDVWDNNTFPFVRAASARGRRRGERRARAGLVWMSGLGESRRAWMVAQAALAGHALGEVLPPALPSRPYRDYLGRIRPVPEELTPQSAEDLSRAYDLSAAEVLDVRVERTGGVLVGALELSAPRLYLSGVAAGRDAATLRLRLREVSEVRFDSADALAVAISADTGSVTVDIGVGVGVGGRIRAKTACVDVQDVDWHLSPAGLRADAAAPRDPDGRSRRSSGVGASPPRGSSGAVALLLHRGMLDVRVVRYGRHSADAAIAEVPRVFDGAADAILAAGAHRRPGRRRAAFQELAETWIRRAGPDLLPSFASALAGSGSAHLLDVIRGAQKRLKEPSNEGDGAVQSAPARAGAAESGSEGSTPAGLQLFRYEAQRHLHDHARQSSAYVVLAVPRGAGAEPDAPWRLRVIEFDAPDRCRVRTEAFQGYHEAPSAVESEGGRGFVLGDGALAITQDEGADTA